MKVSNQGDNGMIITRSPLRITLGGGGTDLPSYYRENEGFVLSATLDKYVYTSLSTPYVDGLNIKYSKFESVKSVNDIEHPLVREVLREFDPYISRLEMTSFADIPAGTGLGSSSSFTTALILAMATRRGIDLSKKQIAELACEIEIERLGEPIGKQDQYASAFGGVSSYVFHKDGSVSAEPLVGDLFSADELQSKLVLFFTGTTRSASEILKSQDDASRVGEPMMKSALDEIKDFGFASRDSLLAGDIGGFGKIMDLHWKSKLKRSKNMSNDSINELYALGIKNGAFGGKLVGAGGGGFLMFVAEEPARLEAAMTGAGLRPLRVTFSYQGAELLLS